MRIAASLKRPPANTTRKPAGWWLQDCPLLGKSLRRRQHVWHQRRPHLQTDHQDYRQLRQDLGHRARGRPADADVLLHSARKLQLRRSGIRYSRMQSRKTLYLVTEVAPSGGDYFLYPFGCDNVRKMKKYKQTKFNAKDSHYDEAAADYAVNLIECLCHTKETWAGKPFELIDWQEHIIHDLFGTLKPNGYRQFNTAYVEISKKMGKSELAAP